ncbi:hypothetical protein C8R44DRAFT_128841 [Mycena epipterygia]|nr:hypothetical protein C8R44DRAFT_128841 [Mycena epipterygia]
MGRTASEEVHYMRQTGRTMQCAKNIKGRYETVWPSNLFLREAALFQGLCTYAVNRKQELDRGVKKCSKRNIIISEFIQRTTNQYRSPSQVGSRLQQLSLSTREPYVRQLISKGWVPDTALSELVKNCSPNLADVSCGSNGDDIVRLAVTIMATSAIFPSLPPDVSLEQPFSQIIRLRTLAEWRPCTGAICGMDPTVSLLSPVPLKLHTAVDVSYDSTRCKGCWSLTSSLDPRGMRGARWEYATSVAGEVWDMLSSQSSSEWTIVQRFFCADDDNDRVFAEVTYRLGGEVIPPRKVNAANACSPDVSLLF